MRFGILTMIVVGDDNSAADQDMISNFNKIGSSYMHRLTDTNVISYDDFGPENLVIVSGNRLYPQAVCS